MNRRGSPLHWNPRSRYESASMRETRRLWRHMVCGAHKKGAGVCIGWEQFEGFLADMGMRPTMWHGISRTDERNSFCAENCQWETRRERDLRRAAVAPQKTAFARRDGKFDWDAWRAAGSPT